MELVIGENFTFTIPIVDVADVPLAISTLSKVKVQVVQYGRTKAEYILKPTPDPVQTEIRVNPSVLTSLDFELTKELSAKLKHGELFLKIFMTKTQATFLTDGEWLDIDPIKLCDMV